MLRRLTKWCIVAAILGVVLIFCAVLWVDMTTRASIYAQASDAPSKEVALVLGASILSSGTLSPVLEERADAAVELYDDKKVSKILVSGDNSSLQYDEVYPVGKYLLSKGVPTSDIFLDYAGFDTYSSMYRAKEIFGVTSMVIVSQRFHLPRALFVAHALGIDAVGLDASKPGDQYFTNAVREIPATIKAIFDLMVERVPRYLGPTFPVSGDGSATWVGSSTQMVYFQNE